MTDRAMGMRALAAPITAITLFGVSLAMSYPLFGLMLERAGSSGWVIGLNTTAAAIAIVVGAPAMPFLLRRFGMGPMLIGATVVLALSMLAVPAGDGFWYWTAIRLVYGFAGTVLFFGSEYWIVAASPEASRGKIVAIYALCVSGGFALGPAILGLTGLTGILPFAVASAIAVAALGPIIWGLPLAPETDAEDRPSPFAALRVFVTDPGVIYAVLLFGAIEFGAMAMIAVWGVRSSLDEADAAFLLAIFALGAMALQMPLGWAADRFDRRHVLAVCALGSALAPLGMIWAGPSYLLIAGFAAFWGAISVGLYSVSLTEIGARYRGTELAVANAAFLLSYGIGALVSPVLFGAAMDMIPPNGLLLLAAMVALAYFALMIARIRRGR